MKFAIIAAGEGSRLAQEGIADPKPLVKVCGERLIDRLIRVFSANGASEIVVICNDLSPMVLQHLQNIQQAHFKSQSVPLRIVVKTTPSSMHSFYEISQHLTDDVFCLTTVDTIFDEREFSDYITLLKQFVGQDNLDGLMGVTRFIDDEKPLYVATDSEENITGFYDDMNGCHLVSGGIYGLSPQEIVTLRNCIERKESRMRNFQRSLISEGRKLKVFEFTKVFDIDHAVDIEKAENFMKEIRQEK